MITRLHGWTVGVLRRHWKRTALLTLGGLLIPVTIAQFVYPANTLLPFTTVEGQNLSGWNKAAAIELLDTRHAEAPINLYFGAEDGVAPYRSPKPAELGITISNGERIESVQYPWYLRLAPGSLLWGHLVTKPDALPTYERNSDVLDSYIAAELSESCVVEPRDAGVAVVEGAITVQRGSSGGTCDLVDVKTLLLAATVDLSGDSEIRVPVEVIPATIDNVAAEDLANKLSAMLKDGLSVVVNNETVTIPKDQLVAWLDFTSVEGKLDYNFNTDRARTYLNDQFASKVSSPAGVTKIATYDFVETSRQTGVSGKGLDVPATLATMKDYIAGRVAQPTVKVALVAPTIEYTRTYSPTYEGLAALMSNFAATHPGTYGVSLIELSGQYRRASYSSAKQFTTASTYKLFVAYSTLLRIESGAWKWSDQIHGGRDLAKCFDDMIVISDNECAHALLEKIGFTTITNEARAIGCSNTSFLGNDGIKTTAEDLALLLAQLQTGQILSQQSNRDLLINTMKRNIYRQGIPKGANGTVADKVGFLDGLLHDAAIVYSSTGPYVLVILTDGSTWGNIAELTRQIEAQRLQ